MDYVKDKSQVDEKNKAIYEDVRTEEVSCRRLLVIDVAEPEEYLNSMEE